TELERIAARKEVVSILAFSRDGKRLATASEDHTARVWDLDTKKPVASFSGHVGVVNAVAFTADGNTLATASEDRTAKLWEVATGKELRTLRGAAGAYLAVAPSPTNKNLIATAEAYPHEPWKPGRVQIVETANDTIHANWQVPGGG